MVHAFKCPSNRTTFGSFFILSLGFSPLWNCLQNTTDQKKHKLVSVSPAEDLACLRASEFSNNRLTELELRPITYLRYLHRSQSLNPGEEILRINLFGDFELKTSKGIYIGNLKHLPTRTSKGCRSNQMKNAHLSCFSKGELCQLNNGKFHQPRNSPLLDQDLNFLPCSVSVSEGGSENHMKESYEPVVAEKKKRATSKHIAGIASSDLAKYFGVPITEASRNLNVGVTVLKRKCREFGIHRWPHRKIKSIDGLIRDLQEEAKHREEDHKALMAVTKRQMLLQSERESIERTPFRELENETKRFRQDVFRRRHKARALDTSQGPSV